MSDLRLSGMLTQPSPRDRRPVHTLSMVLWSVGTAGALYDVVLPSVALADTDADYVVSSTGQTLQEIGVSGHF